MIEAFEARRTDGLFVSSLLWANRLDVREASPQFTEKTKNLLAGLVPDSPHHVDIGDREIQEVSNRDDVGPFQRITTHGLRDPTQR